MNPYIIKAGDNVSIIESPGFPFNIFTINSTGTETGTSDHTLLTNRNVADQHPQLAITGLVVDLDGKVDDYQVLTDVPVGAVFTDTTYTIGNGGLTEINFTQSDKDTIDGIGDVNVSSTEAMVIAFS